MKKIYFLAISILLLSFSQLTGQTLLADYPLISDGVDITGNNGDMSISEAPFQNGGIYSNGIYYGNDPDGSHIQSPQIENFDFDNLTANIDFKLEEYPENRIPILMLGTSWRWLSAWMELDKIAIKVNNGSIYEISDVVVSLDEWHSLSLSYNKTEGKAKLFLNYELVLSVDVAELQHGDNARVVNSDGGSGIAYKGYWRNLKIYNSSVVAGISDQYLNEINIHTVNGKLVVENPISRNPISMKVFDVNGRELADYKLTSGLSQFTLSCESQILLVVLTDESGNKITKKVFVQN